MSRVSRASVVLLGVAALGASMTTGTGWAASPTPQPAASQPAFPTLSPQQVAARSSGPRAPMVVVFDDQLTTQPANKAHRQARAQTAASQQAPLLAQLHQVGATGITSLWLLNAVAATMPSSEAAALRATPGVKAVVPDSEIVVGQSETDTNTVGAGQVQKPIVAPTAASGQRLCTTATGGPLTEPEALSLIHATSGLTAGHGVIVGNVDANSLAGNTNMIRPNGEHVIIDAPNPNENSFSDEFNGDVSTIGAQGTVVYTYASQLPYSTIPANCRFTIVGDAPGASLVSTGYFNDKTADGSTQAPASAVIAGLQRAVSLNVDVVSESYGYGPLPGAYNQLLAPTNVAMVQAGVVVVEASGDSGSAGTVWAPANNPEVIDVGGTTDFRLTAQTYGYKQGWDNNNMTTLSSGGTAPNNRVVDLVAPGYGSLAVAGIHGQPAPALPTEAFGGTSESAPFVSGAAADVIQAYRDSHDGASPTPAQVKQVLTGTATDIGAPADQQGAGLVNITAAMAAAQQLPNTSQRQSATSALVSEPTQLNLQGAGGSTVSSSVTLYNASSRAQTVSGTFRSLGAETPLGQPVTEQVSAPAPGAPIPTQGATAARAVHFTVPSGTSVLDADMRWPDPTNDNANILAFLLTDPQGKVAQESYDYGASEYVPCAGGGGCSPNIQHATVQRPAAGTWTAQILWSNGRGHDQSPPDDPGPYRGTVTFQASAQNFVWTHASAPVTIAARGWAAVPLRIAMPAAAGDAPESVQFTGSNGLLTSVPISRRTLVASGGSFTATLTSSVSRGPGQIQTFDLQVPAGLHDLDISLHSPDAAPDNPVYYYLFSPGDLATANPIRSGFPVTAVDATPTSGNPTGNASLIAPNPQAGTWEIDVMQGPVTSGTRFAWPVTGRVAYNQLAPVTATGLPTSTATIVDAGSTIPITVRVTNTTNHDGFFELQPSNDDITGGNTTRPKELAPGQTGTLTAALSPTAPAGTTVRGTLRVVFSTDVTGHEPAQGFPLFSDFRDFPYAYRVGG